MAGLAVAIIMCPLSAAAGPRQPSSPHRHHRRVHHARSVANTRPVAAVPVLPLSTSIPDPQPATSIVASYHEGSLAVDAQNAPIGEILDRIHESTGAIIEAPLLDERISVQLAPQPPVQAITALLEGMHLNYVILGGTSVQDHLQYVIVTPRPAASPPPSHPGMDEALAEARARALTRFTEETGGDEGVWDNGPQSLPAPASPAGLPVRN